MEARKAALILMKNSHFDRTPQYPNNVSSTNNVCKRGSGILKHNCCRYGYGKEKYAVFSFFINKKQQEGMIMAEKVLYVFSYFLRITSLCMQSTGI